MSNSGLRLHLDQDAGSCLAFTLSVDRGNPLSPYAFHSSCFFASCSSVHAQSFSASWLSWANLLGVPIFA